MCLLSYLCSEVRMITYFFSFSCCAQAVDWVFACLHHGIRFYSHFLASIRVIVLGGRSEQMFSSAIHWPPDIYFNFIIGAYHALVTERENKLATAIELCTAAWVISGVKL